MARRRAVQLVPVLLPLVLLLASSASHGNTLASTHGRSDLNTTIALPSPPTLEPVGRTTGADRPSLGVAASARRSKCGQGAGLPQNNWEIPDPSSVLKTEPSLGKRVVISGSPTNTSGTVVYEAVVNGTTVRWVHMILQASDDKDDVRPVQLLRRDWPKILEKANIDGPPFLTAPGLYRDMFRAWETEAVRQVHRYPLRFFYKFYKFGTYGDPNRPEYFDVASVWGDKTNEVIGYENIQARGFANV